MDEMTWYLNFCFHDSRLLSSHGIWEEPRLLIDLE